MVTDFRWSLPANTFHPSFKTKHIFYIMSNMEGICEELTLLKLKVQVYKCYILIAKFQISRGVLQRENDKNASMSRYL